MKKDLKSQMWIGFVCVILGFVVTLQLKSVYRNSGGAREMQRSETLLTELNNQKQINSDLSEKMEKMKEEIDFYRSRAGEESEVSKVMSEQLEMAEVLAGLADTTGAGIILTLNDSKIKSEQNPENFIIHDEDLRKVVNELYSAGAEAISINGERMITTSSIRCVGPAILINGNKYAPPFEIRAIGNPKTLTAAVNLNGGVVDILKNLWKIEVEVKEYSKVDVPKYSGAVNFKYAEIAAKE